MKKMTVLDRVLLLLTGLVAAYQIVVGIEGSETVALWAYTVAFGVILVSGLLLIIQGFEILESPLVVIVTTLIPLSLSLGLVWEHLPGWRVPYLVFAIVGFTAVAITRFAAPKRVAVFTLMPVHGVAGLLIFGLPIIMSLRGDMPGGFALVGVGGGLIGIGGLLLSFLKAGKPILPQKNILTVLPSLLFLMTAAFAAGFALV
ncbi:MAG: hypothetical protein GY803_16455 [Chloroflexi bacterium]|nr:hypothetical protein [Chloroflexota bacterium]